MANLSDEPFEKVINDKDLDEIQAIIRNEQVWGVVQCDNCNYWGRMEGIIDGQNKKVIQFVCPECTCVEYVNNPEVRG